MALSELHQTFLFADIAGFTALTEAHGDDQAADLAEWFCSEVAARIPDGAGDVVKTIGDAVMVRVDDARTALDLGMRIAGEVMNDHGSPTVRVGMHRGAAVLRDGDWFGATVNTAARVAARAAGGEILITAAVKDAIGELDGISVESRGEQRLRNVAAPVPLYAVLVAGPPAESSSLDPVCRMVIHHEHAAGVLRHDGTEYRFCSLECAARFAADPGTYAGGAEGR